MQKILIITDAWAPQVNGVAMVLDRITKIIVEKGYDVQIIQHNLFHSFNVPFFPEVRIAFFPGRRIKKILFEEKPDYVHIATEGQLGFIARIICAKKKIKFTTAYHTNFDLYLQARVSQFMLKIVGTYLRWFHNGSVATMVSTRSLKKELEKKGFRNVVITPLGVDTELFEKSKEAISPYPKPIFTYLGRIAKEKNVEEFLNCNLSGTKLIIGDGPQRKQLEKIYGNNAVFLGAKIGQELVDLLSQSDVLVFPSRTDTFGLVIVEALACGVPVAAHNVMGPKDIITHNIDGFLDEDLGLAARECLKLDRNACRKKALMFSWENSADTFLRNLQ